MNNHFIEKLENLPVPILPTFVGALTLSNVYQGLGFSWIRHVTMWIATIIWICYIIKILNFPNTFKKEYSNTVPSSLYAGFTMIMMLLGSYYIQFHKGIGKGLWFSGIIIHMIHILVFTYRNIIKKFNKETFLPSWFVTYNGIMVSAVVGGLMDELLVCKFITYYGIFTYIIILPFMISRLIKFEIKREVYHTQAILLAPCSLCLVSYLNTVEDPNIYLIGFLYIAVLISLGFLIYKLPVFFSMDFSPSYAGMTFPMAIGIVASNKISEFLDSLGYEFLSYITTQIVGFQIYLTTGIIAYVLLKFLIMALGTREKVRVYKGIE